MKFSLQIITMFVLATGVAHSQEHVHGQGSVFIAQEGNLWQVQYVLPAADALGFEHKPENKQQRKTYTELTKSIKTYSYLMRLNAQCTQESYSHNLIDLKDDHHDKHDDHHDKHNDHHDKHDDHHDKHEGHDHDDHQASHKDVEVSYTLKCANSVSTISFDIFNKMKGLEKLEVQWSVNQGQGSAMSTPTSPVLKLVR